MEDLGHSGQGRHPVSQHPAKEAIDFGLAWPKQTEMPKEPL